VCDAPLPRNFADRGLPFWGEVDHVSGIPTRELCTPNFSPAEEKQSTASKEACHLFHDKSEFLGKSALILKQGFTLSSVRSGLGRFPISETWHGLCNSTKKRIFITISPKCIRWSIVTHACGLSVWGIAYLCTCVSFGDRPTTGSPPDHKMG
jgi:hypothetical protein